jgi:ribonuclease E
MTKRMLIEATHPEETRVVVVDGKKLEEFDYESATKRQLKGNIYLAKVTRVEPSLQAAFVDYGGNRHGFLAFSEIHPDYYRIPVADREALIAEHTALEAADEAEADGDEDLAANLRADFHTSTDIAIEAPETVTPADTPSVLEEAEGETDGGASHEAEDADHALPLIAHGERLVGPEIGDEESAAPVAETAAGEEAGVAEGGEMQSAAPISVVEATPQPTVVETVGGDEAEEIRRRRMRPQRRYKIQEVIKRRQIMLVQVTKEERGNKGAALTTYLSLAGRYCVLMPNTGRGGGISRKITSAGDRKRLKSILEDMNIPDGMAVIVRTAGSERNKTELKRDYEYLIRLWDEIREHTLKSTAPTLIYEEASLIKRAIRDLYSRDIEEVLVEGDEAYKAGKNFMRTLMPSHAKRVQLYRDPSVHLFHRFQIENQLDAIHNPVVHLKSGGYIVINSTEALVAIDVNSGRATRERNIEETALRTNLEAADEVARQLRLRDLAGLIVIDFIDMEESRNNAAVERRLKEAMRHDRARIQVGRISAFGLLELSRQRLRPSLIEASTEICRHCRGTGHIRSTESTALHVLRAIEEECMRNRNAGLAVSVPTSAALYILNNKRAALSEIEQRNGIRVTIGGDDSLIPPEYRIERIKGLVLAPEARLPVSQTDVHMDDTEVEEEAEAEEEAAQAPREERAERAERAERDDEGGGRRRGRRRRRRRDDGRGQPAGDESHRHPVAAVSETVVAEPSTSAELETRGEAAAVPSGEPGERNGAPQDGDGRRRRRRGRRGGRRRRRGGERGDSFAADQNAGQPQQDDGPFSAEDGGEDSGPDDSGWAPEDDAPLATAGESEETSPVEAETANRDEGEPHSWRSRRHDDGDRQREADRDTAAPADVDRVGAAPEHPIAHRPAGGADPIVAAAAPSDEPHDDASHGRSSDHPDDDRVSSPSSPPRRGWWKRLME